MPDSCIDLDEIPLSDLLEIEIEAGRQSDSSGSIRLVTFVFNDNLYGIAVEEVAEVTYPLPISPLPNSPEHLCGISPLRGELVAVIDLRRLLGETAPTAQMSARPKFIILRSYENNMQMAFQVDRVCEIASAGEIIENIDHRPGFIVSVSAMIGDRTAKIISSGDLSAFFSPNSAFPHSRR